MGSAQSLRSFVHRPLVPLLAVLSLTLGLGFAAAAFSFVDALFFSRLAVEDSDRLVVIYGLDTANPGLLPISLPNVEDVERSSTTLSGVAAYSWSGATLVGGDRPQRLLGQIVDEDFFRVLGVQAIHGRTFTDDDVGTIVLSDALARALFDGVGEAAVGETVLLNGEPYAVAGVAPGDFSGVGAMGMVADFWLPMSAFHAVSAFAEYQDSRDGRLFGAIGRLADGVSRTEAEAELDRFAAGLRREFPEDNAGLGFTARPIDQSVLDPNRREQFVRAGWMLALLGALLLAMVCANVSTLLSIRNSRRAKDDAVRAAVGAGPGHLAWLTLREGLWLSVIGGLLGIGLAALVQRLVWSHRPPWIDAGSFQVGFDSGTLLFVAATVVVTGVLSSLGAILGSRHHDLMAALKLGPGGIRRPSGRFGLHDALVAFQVAVALTALAAAGLFLRSLDAATRLDLGVATEEIALFPYDLSGAGLAPAEAAVLGRALTEEVAALPGVVSAALAGEAPLSAYIPRHSFHQSGEAASEAPPAVEVNVVSTGYFGTLGIPLLKGRDFSSYDREQSERVAVVNDAMVRRFWGGGEAVGERFHFGDRREVTVVGVVGDSLFGLVGDEVRPMIFLPLEQHHQDDLILHLRAAGSAAALLDPVTEILQRKMPDVPLTGVETLSERFAAALWAPRLGAIVVSTVGVVSVVLAVVGVYGVVGSSMRRRRREIGVRLATGGQPGRVIREMVQALAVGPAVGLLAGVVVALAVLRLTRNLLYGVGPADPLSLLGAFLVVAAASLLAAWMPAWLSVRSTPFRVLQEPW